ncbi:ARM repeat-containing protein [Teratosphaeria nubilosa]|uniref:ARM repeat-containing protein n=1 Tax=Teratosphaeria nubilosa TaxID=161662 RepID=A0A6G1L2Q6_9PEZI|nr:ARM repeat-containing protein [Teratosphaeria nubilosa]
MGSFAIEVPGESNPLTGGLLVNTLRSASSSDLTQIQTGTKQLQSWEKSPGYYSQLQSAYLSRDLPLELRYLAIIQLKNGVDKYWRKTALNAVPKHDKDVIRSRLLSGCLEEQDDRLALQNALVIAKIARHEYPNDWPDLLSSILDSLRNASSLPPLHLARSLLVLLHVVKELATGRLQRTRQTMQAASPEIVHVLSELYVQTVSYWQSNLDENGMKLSLLVIKSLRRLLIVGYEHPNRNQEVISFWSATQQLLGPFMQLRSSAGQSLLLEKNILQLAKLHHEMAKEHPAAFTLLPNSMDLARSYWILAKDFGTTCSSKDKVASAIAGASIGTDGDAEDDKSTTEKLALRGLLILRACVKMVHNPTQTFKYRTAEDKEEKNRATEIVRQSLLSTAFVQEIMETVVTKFFVFRPSDLREWEEEPEEWEKREDGNGEDWEFSIRSCSEKLFLDLAIHYKEMLVQPLLQVFYSVATPNNEDVLFKDSVYTAIGLAAPVVHEQLDFDAFVRDVLVLELQKQKPGFNILRRRAAILLAQWISIRLSERQLVYQIFQHLLSKDDLNDQVVRVTAGRQLTRIVDDWETKADELQPYVDPILQSLLSLIQEVELTETKMALVNTMSVIVDRMEYRIAPFAERIVSILPTLWEASGDEHLMKQTILTILARLVNAMKAESQPLHSMVYPIIKGAVQPGSDTEVYLLEDALDLWASVVQQTVQPASQEALDLAQHLIPIYDYGSESLRIALEITESYVLLAPEYILSSSIRQPLFTALANTLRSLRGKCEANGLVCGIVEVAIRQASTLGGETAVEQLVTDLTPLYGVLLEGLRGSWTAHCTTGPLAKDPLVDGVIETDYFAILARTILGSLGGFSKALDVAAPQAGSGIVAVQDTLKWLLEEWFSHFENIGDPSRRKLMVLALTKLLETNQSVILLNLQSLMTIWTDVINELREGAVDVDATGGKQDSLVYDPSAAVSDPHEAPEDGRKRQRTYSDEVHTISLPEYVRAHLQKVIAASGGRFEEEWLINVDKDVVYGFGQLGIMR